MTQTVEDEKRAAALAAVRAEVRPGMVVGLGTGTTARYVIEEIARLIRAERMPLRGVPSSIATANLARSLGIPLVDLEISVDVAIDGADEIDPQRNLIKGGGGAMTREKCVAVAARRFVVVADASKLVERLSRPVPVEVLAFALPLVQRLLRERLPGCEPKVRRQLGGALFITDNGNPVLDVAMPPECEPRVAADVLATIPGIVGHGYFLDMNPIVYVAGPDGVQTLS